MVVHVLHASQQLKLCTMHELSHAQWPQALRSLRCSVLVPATKAVASLGVRCPGDQDAQLQPGILMCGHTSLAWAETLPYTHMAVLPTAASLETTC